MKIAVLCTFLPAAASGLVLTGHRGGMSGTDSFVPEHSKAAYALGASYGAAFIEPDVISTKDHVLMVMHGNELGRTSDVAQRPEFADRYTTKVRHIYCIRPWCFVNVRVGLFGAHWCRTLQVVDDGDGCTTSTVTGWFSEDFTWDEVCVVLPDDLA